MKPVVATRAMPATPGAVLAFLADLENHARLAPGSVTLLSLERLSHQRAQAHVRLKGPLGVRREADTDLWPQPPDSIAGRARVGERTQVSVRWTVDARPWGCVVTLAAAVDAASPVDVLLLHLGGRRWLGRHFLSALDQLDRELSPASAGRRYGHLVDQPSLSPVVEPQIETS